MPFRKVGKPIPSGKLQNSNSRKMRDHGTSGYHPGGGTPAIPTDFGLPGWPGECFVAGTKVTMGDGSEKNIEDIAVGEEVLSYNVKTKEFETKQVSDVITQTHDLKDGDITVKITLEDDVMLHATIANPFWTPDEIFAAVDEERCNRVHEWVKETNDGRDVVGLDIGDTVFRYVDGTLNHLTIQGIEYVMEKDIRTYDVTVDDNHTFFANGVLTHNSTPPPHDWSTCPNHSGNWATGDWCIGNAGCCNAECCAGECGYDVHGHDCFVGSGGCYGRCRCNCRN